MVRKILIMPFYGQFHNYFSFWLYSCGKNKTTDFLIITDNPQPHSLPENVIWIEKSFASLQQLFRQKMDCKLWLKTPYKLCDYKGFYGYLFSEYLLGYDFWGYCDCDVILGDLDSFLPESIYHQYDKIFLKGHLAFIRNAPEINENFRKFDNYCVALSTPIMYGYDEAVYGYRMGMAGELIEQGFRFCPDPAQPADIDYRHFPFYVIGRKQTPCVFTYENGKIFRHVQGENKEEMIYLHLQKRSMQVTANTPDELLIYPNVIAPLDRDVLKQNAFWDMVSEEKVGYFDFRAERRRERWRDVRRLLHEPRKMECIRYRLHSRR